MIFLMKIFKGINLYRRKYKPNSQVLTALGLLTLVLMIPTQAFASKKILIISSYSDDSEWQRDCKASLFQVLDHQFKLFEYEMDTKRIPAEEYAQRASEAWQMYLRIEPDLVVLGDDSALKMIGPRLVGLDTPVVYLGINQNPRQYFTDYQLSRKNITGLLERPLLKRSLAKTAGLFTPPADKILLLFDNGTTSKSIVEEALGNKLSFVVAHTRIETVLVASWERWQQLVLTAADKGYDAIVVATFDTLSDHSGQNINGEKVLKWVSENSPVPPFTLWGNSVGPQSTIGGYVILGEEHGKQAARIVLKILSGTDPWEIHPETHETGSYYFSRSLLEKFGIELPDNVINQSIFTN
ncbi:MAG: ABC transporter substrate binding protein [Halopseudomonas sp.]